ncbi:MAG: LacI family DNA-binding transcriptional regulator, partial [Pseudomonadota bacterium]
MPKPSQQRRPSLKDIAQRTGVSVMTVSNVLNKQGNVGPETRKKIEEVIKEIDYVPFQAARSLRTKQHRLVGLLIIDDNEAYLNDPILASIVAAINKKLSDLDYTLLLELSTTAKINEIGPFRRQLLDSMVVISCGNQRKLKALANTLDQNRVPKIYIQSV